MTGQTLAHYRILEKIGAGGMGEVYRAHDQQLERDVAIKLLPASSFADSTARLRLLREARAAAALNHPHICTVHEVGEADSQTYIAMELVDGESLSSRLLAGPLTPDQVIRFGIHLADALAHAHERGIVHRDLKAANVIINSDGRPKILDFGLAKRLSQEEFSEVTTKSQLSLTERGSIVGTLAYMSPEQLRGQPADGRSDIWALGVMLYEMVSGVRPFQGQTGYELSSAILNDSPEPLPSKVAAELQNVISRCLEKEPGRRYQRAGEVRAALEAIQSGAVRRQPAASQRARQIVLAAAVGALLIVAAITLLRRDTPLWGGPRLKSLAVLPFDNLSKNPEQEYFVAGMHDAVIGELSQLGALRVISRTSAAKYKDSKKSIPEIARELNVDGVVEASVLRAGDTVRVQVQLIEARPEERHLWAQTYDRDIRDVLALHTEVARSIAREIRVGLSPQQQTRLASSRSVNREAYEAYLRGMHHLNTFTPEGYQKGLAYLHEAVDKDPANPRTYAGLAVGYALVGHGSGAGSGPDGFAKARAAAQKALELDDTIAEAHGAMAEVKAYYEWDWDGARREFERALQLNPNLDEVHRHYAWLHALQGRMDDALREAKLAQEINPLRTVLFADMGWLHLFTGDYDRALAEAQKAIDLHAAMNTKPGGALNVLGWAYAGKGMFDQAIAAHKNVLTNRPELAGSKAALAMTYARAGRTKEARMLLDEILKEKRSFAWRAARVYAVLGDTEEAFHWVEVCYKERDWRTPWIFHEAIFEKTRDDPRYHDLMRRLKLQA